MGQKQEEGRGEEAQELRPFGRLGSCWEDVAPGMGSGIAEGQQLSGWGLREETQAETET